MKEAIKKKCYRTGLLKKIRLVLNLKGGEGYSKSGGRRLREHSEKKHGVSYGSGVV